MSTLWNVNLITPKRTEDEHKDVIGNELRVGSYVIWQPYTSAGGMRFGKIVYRSDNPWGSLYAIKTINDDGTQSKTITRRSSELISYLPLVMHAEQYKNEIHLEV